MALKRKSSKSGMNPLPSLIKASAFDSANMRMIGDGRKQWNDDDWNAMCETQERLITACYGLSTDADPRIKYIRFSLATQLENQGDFTLYSDFPEIFAWIENYLDAPAEQAA